MLLRWWEVFNSEKKNSWKIMRRKFSFNTFYFQIIFIVFSRKIKNLTLYTTFFLNCLLYTAFPQLNSHPIQLTNHLKVNLHVNSLECFLRMYTIYPNNIISSCFSLISISCFSSSCLPQTICKALPFSSSWV